MQKKEKLLIKEMTDYKNYTEFVEIGYFVETKRAM